jgi:DNA-binding response OmpR family regulator
MGRKGGKRFSCTIQIRQIAKPKSSPNPRNKSSHELSLNVLLAEDERSVAFSIFFALKVDGHKIEIVSDGEKALSEVTRKPGAFDLVITNHSMPRMNGVELVKRLRGMAFRGKIVVLSAHLSEENRVAYLSRSVWT